MTYRKKHIAKCSHCQAVAEVRDSGTFIDPFFLPNMCASCGESMQDRWPNKERPHWIHVVVKEKWEDAIRTRYPLSWFRFGRWVEVERHEWAA